MIKTETIQAEMNLEKEEGIGGDLPKMCPYRGDNDWWVPCIGTKCEKGKTGECLRS
jgi:hypothetical protein